jgi:mannose-6-phosphate isomerase-like protein (cupin superfamily)
LTDEKPGSERPIREINELDLNLRKGWQMNTIKEMLKHMCQSYQRKMEGNEELIVEIRVLGMEDVWHIQAEPKCQAVLRHGQHPQALLKAMLTAETLSRLFAGDLSPLTAVGRAKMSDTAPLDYALGDGVEFTPQLYAQMIAFTQKFFNPHPNNKILLGEQHTRLVHGGHVVGLFYHPGFRSAWYTLQQGEQLNGPGETNPFPQAFIFLSGEGQAKLGDQTVNVKGGEAYFIQPGTEHILRNMNKEPLILIFLAWGDKA